MLRKIKLKKHSKSSLSNSIQIRIRMTLIKQRLSSRKLQMLTRHFRMRRKGKHMINSVRKVLDSKKLGVKVDLK
jgi:hypothetical protein